MKLDSDAASGDGKLSGSVKRASENLMPRGGGETGGMNIVSYFPDL
jgi:hypothetical protein